VAHVLLGRYFRKEGHTPGLSHETDFDIFEKTAAGLRSRAPHRERRGQMARVLSAEYFSQGRSVCNSIDRQPPVLPLGCGGIF